MGIHNNVEFVFAERLIATPEKFEGGRVDQQNAGPRIFAAFKNAGVGNGVRANQTVKFGCGPNGLGLSPGGIAGLSRPKTVIENYIDVVRYEFGGHLPNQAQHAVMIVGEMLGRRVGAIEYGHPFIVS